MSQIGERGLDQASPIYVPPRMLKDLHGVSQIPIEVINTVTKALAAETGFLTADRLNSAVARIIPDAKQAEAVANTVFSVPTERVESLLTTLRAWREQKEDYKQVLTERILHDLSDRLKALCVSYPAIERFRKAMVLAQITGDRCDIVDILCDLRPVFDVSRESVEGLVPIVTMRIGFTDQDNGDGTAEYRLSEDDLDDLEEKIAFAKQKLSVMKRCAGQWIPEGWVGKD